MRLERIEYENWCQHRSRIVEFHPGLNAFLGRNGSGKTNALNGVVFALTGDHSRNEGVKADNVSQLVPDNAPSSVTLTFLHKDLRCVVKRGLRGAQSNLKVLDLQGATLETQRGDTKVTKRLFEILGVNPRMLLDYVFVDQGEMFAPFAAGVKPADRAVAFQRLFGIDRAEAIWDALGECLSGMPALEVPDVAAAEAAVAQANETRLNCDLRLGHYADLQGWQRDTDPDWQIIRSYTNASAVRLTLEQAHQDRLTILRQQRDSRRQVRQLTARQRQLQGIDGQLSAGYTAAQDVLRQAATMQQRAQRRQTLATEIQRLIADNEAATAQATQAALARQTASGGFSESQLRAAISQLQQDIAVDEATLGRVGTDNVCPTCGQPLTEQVVVEKRRAESRVQANRVTLNQHQTWLQAFEAAQFEQRRQDNAAAGRAARLQALQAENASLDGGHLLDPQSVQQAQELVSGVDQVRAELHTLAGQLQPAAQFAESQERAATTARLRARQTRAVLAAAPTAEDYQAATTRFQVTERRVLELSGILGEQRLAIQHQQEAHARLQGAQAQAAQVARQMAVRTRIQNTRGVLHRDVLPAQITKRQLEVLCEKTNEVLAIFSVNYRLIMDETGLSYIAVFFDGRQQPLRRLSGGEKVIVALAFRIAVNSRFARDLGMLCLDEPTVYLDADNIGCLDAALDCLRRFSQTRGLQCILITHEAVGHLFDHVTDFSHG